MSIFLGLTVAFSAKYSLALSTSFAYLSIPTDSPSVINCPISINTREGDCTLNALLIVLDTLFAIDLAVALTRPAPARKPLFKPAIALTPATLSSELSRLTVDTIRLFPLFTVDTICVNDDCIALFAALNPWRYNRDTCVIVDKTFILIRELPCVTVLTVSFILRLIVASIVLKPFENKLDRLSIDDVDARPIDARPVFITVFIFNIASLIV